MTIPDFHRGDTVRFRSTITDPTEEDNPPVSLAGLEVWCTIKRTPKDAEDKAIYRGRLQVDGDGVATIEDGAEIDGDAADGVIAWEVSPEQSGSIKPITSAVPYHYDIQVRLPDGVVRTTETGTVNVLPDVTHEGTMAVS